MPLSGVLDQLLNYWQNLPRTNSATLPKRSALTPSHLHEILPRLTLYKRLSRYDMTIAMMCTGNDDQWSSPLVGINAFDLTAANMRENTAKLYSAILDQPAAAVMRETVRQKDGHNADVASLYLPLADDSGTPTYIIGCTVYEKRPTYASINDRLVLDHQMVRKIQFIDIGNGEPYIMFQHAEPQRAVLSESSWWDRFVPRLGKSTPIHRLDS